jgi:hypothetical protein
MKKSASFGAKYPGGWRSAPIRILTQAGGQTQ